ncbi:MAG: carbohydrate ABC transporter permease, partial [Nevskiales bacterium]
MSLRRGMFLSGVVALCAWTLVPIYLIAVSAAGGRAMVDTWPKPFLPIKLSVAALQQFLHISGVWASVG